MLWHNYTISWQFLFLKYNKYSERLTHEKNANPNCSCMLQRLLLTLCKEWLGLLSFWFLCLLEAWRSEILLLSLRPCSPLVLLHNWEKSINELNNAMSRTIVVLNIAGLSEMERTKVQSVENTSSHFTLTLGGHQLFPVYLEMSEMDKIISTSPEYYSVSREDRECWETSLKVLYLYRNRRCSS